MLPHPDVVPRDRSRFKQEVFRDSFDGTTNVPGAGALGLDTASRPGALVRRIRVVPSLDT